MRLLLWFSALLTACAAPVSGTFDLWIRGGTVIDGTGAPPRRADLLVREDEIAWVGAVADAGRIEVETTIDAAGMIVAPGFIDPHAHGDPLRAGAFRNFLAMGVTTICLGQDGSSPSRRELAPWLRAARGKPLGVNVIPFVGHGTARRTAGVDLEPDPTPAQVEAIAAAVDADMKAGAFGMSTGLEYEPGRFATAEELAATARRVAAHGGFVMSHMRSEDDDQIEAAVTELLDQCRAAGCPAHVSHMKIVYARTAQRAREVLALLDGARRDGLRVSADVYPYLASYTGIGIVFPGWAKPPHDYAEVVANRRDELADYLRRRVTLRNGPDATVFGTGQWAGRSLAEVAKELDKSFEDVLIDDFGPRGGSAAYFVMNRDVMATLLAHPWVVVSSDGSPTMRHPRGHGAFARVIREFVVELEMLTLPDAVRKMSGLTAEILGLDDRGVLAAGKAADVIVFDPAQVRDRATFEDPFQHAEGFRHVIVNGQLARRDDAFTDARPGRLLTR